MIRFKLTRDVTRFECPWLQRDYEKGETLRESTEFHYGCISPSGISCMELKENSPFFEIPKDALNVSEVLLQMYNEQKEYYMDRNRGIKLTVVQDLSVEEYPFILKDFKRGDVLYFYPNYDPRRVYVDCIPAVLNTGEHIYFELPNGAVRSILG